MTGHSSRLEELAAQAGVDPEWLREHVQLLLEDAGAWPPKAWLEPDEAVVENPGRKNGPAVWLSRSREK
jgi:hypothetical protein